MNELGNLYQGLISGSRSGLSIILDGKKATYPPRLGSLPVPAGDHQGHSFRISLGLREKRRVKF